MSWIRLQKLLGSVLFALLVVLLIDFGGDLAFRQPHTGPDSGAPEPQTGEAPAEPGAGGQPAPPADGGPSAPAPADGGSSAPAPADGGPSARAPAGGAPQPQASPAAAVDKGRAVSRRCISCHTFEPGAPHRVGPNLAGVVGAPKASKDGYAYSAALTALGGTWTEADVDAFLTNPAGYAPGTKMTFAGLKDADERAAIIAYMRSQTAAVGQ